LIVHATYISLDNLDVGDDFLDAASAAFKA
jgi:hypothetical protein